MEKAGLTRMKEDHRKVSKDHIPHLREEIKHQVEAWEVVVVDQGLSHLLSQAEEVGLKRLAQDIMPGLHRNNLVSHLR